MESESLIEWGLEIPRDYYYPKEGPIMVTRYNEDFKLEVVKAYMAGERSMSKLSADYNIAKSTLTGWGKI